MIIIEKTQIVDQSGSANNNFERIVIGSGGPSDNSKNGISILDYFSNLFKRDNDTALDVHKNQKLHAVVSDSINRPKNAKNGVGINDIIGVGIFESGSVRDGSKATSRDSIYKGSLQCNKSMIEFMLLPWGIENDKFTSLPAIVQYVLFFELVKFDPWLSVVDGSWTRKPLLTAMTLVWKPSYTKKRLDMVKGFVNPRYEAVKKKISEHFVAPVLEAKDKANVVASHAIDNTIVASKSSVSFVKEKESIVENYIHSGYTNTVNFLEDLNDRKHKFIKNCVIHSEELFYKK